MDKGDNLLSINDDLDQILRRLEDLKGRSLDEKLPESIHYMNNLFHWRIGKEILEKIESSF